MRNMLFFTFTMVILIILSACNEADNNEVKNINYITPVQTAEIKTGDFIVESTIYGQISPSKQTPILIQQPGEITTLKVENGDQVKKDDHIATINTQMGTQTIYAPSGGEIAHLSLHEKGYYVNEEPLAYIIDTEKLNINFFVTPKMRGYFKKGETLSVIIEDKEYNVTISSIDSMANESGQYLIQAQLDNEEQYILPGMTAKIIIKEVRVKDTIIVPTEAVMTESDETYVFVVKDDVAKKVRVDIKNTQTEQTAVEAELTEKDLVIVSGQFTLSDGSKVEVVKEGKES